ncbi:MAG: hypothetical protein JWR16_2968 [Nevskia sp.]|nr:hypothetical protein [Nevskia sp.]
MSCSANKLRLQKRSHRIVMAISMQAISGAVQARDIERQLHYVVTVEARQTWKRSDPKTGEEWSKATTTQRYEITTRLKSDGQLQVRNLEDLDRNTRFEAKIIFLARRAKKEFEASGHPFQLPRTPEEKAALSNRMQEDISACKGDQRCNSDVTMRYASIFAALEYPAALEEDTVPGTYLYFLPFHGCAEQSRVTLEMQIDGVRFNKDVDRLVPFSEHHSADSIDSSDGLALCDHFGATIDTQDSTRSMYLDNVFIPRPVGATIHTENGHTSTQQEPQPVPSAVVDWLAATLRHAASSGSVTTTLPLPLSLNGNSTWLGLWQGAAKVSFQWSFTEVAPVATR